jgi:hypothetical protein
MEATPTNTAPIKNRIELTKGIALPSHALSETDNIKTKIITNACVANILNFPTMTKKPPLNTAYLA